MIAKKKIQKTYRMITIGLRCMDIFVSVLPFVIRRTKSALNRRAQYDAIESFVQNLKNLLQTPPVRGCPILGVDPGILIFVF